MQQPTFVKRVSILITFMLVPAVVFSQVNKLNGTSVTSAGAPGAFLRTGVGTRALSMGGAFTAVASGPSAAYWNPAALDRSNHAGLELMNVNLPFERTANYFGGAFPIGGLFTLGVSWIGLKIDGIEGRTGNTLQPDFFFSSRQDAFFLSFGKTLTYNLAIGASVKLIRNDLHSDVATGLGFDAGVTFQVNDRLALGLVAQDIGTDYRWDNGLTEEVPMTLRLGTAFELYDGVTFAADVNKTEGASPTFHVGAELRPVRTLPIRVGLDHDRFTGGAGFAFPVSRHMLELSYGYSTDRIVNDDIHRVSLVFSFGAKKSPRYSTPGNTYSGSRSAQNNEMKYASAKPKVQVTARVLNVRSGPGTRYVRIVQVRRGETFVLMEKKKVWWKIRLSDGRTGWLHSKYVRLLEE